MTFKDEFLRYQLRQWEATLNMLHEKRLQDLVDLVGHPEGWVTCQARIHQDEPHKATHWILLTCGCDALICTERVEHAMRVMQRDGSGACPLCDAGTCVDRIEPLNP